MAGLNAGSLWREASRRPLLLVAGVAGVGLLAVIAAVRKPAEELPVEPTPAEEPDLLGAADTIGGYVTGSPYEGVPGAGYDPFAGADSPVYPTGGDTSPGVTAEGCTWPPPAIPTGMEGRGSWQCDPTGPVWVWHWIDAAPVPGEPPGTSPSGCPAPKPTLPPRLIGQYKYACRSGQWKLIKVAGTAEPPPRTPPNGHPTPQPTPNVSAGAHVTFAGHRNNAGKLVLTDRHEFTLARSAAWRLAGATTGDRTPGQSGGSVRVRKIEAAPGHSGQAGRWLKV